MKEYVAQWALVVFSFFGIADSAYLAQGELRGILPSCLSGGVNGCQVVAKSVYAHLFGIPLGIYGLIFYIVVFTIAVWALFMKHAPLKRTLRAVSAIGVFVSIILFFVQLSLINAFCLYCEISAVLATFIFVVAWLPEKSDSTI
ncbi:hypothetical protein MNBD_CPR01-463 [hydrothermal vent metagenome]|uniref:Vitamin K epoxide reductase domain-containing protein n=1 Tax=hydrothermal vent metagenome TaxID=652676 RepID=A0A3B0UQG9_9ZZZZ